jgi:hypothetical protein
LICEDLPALYGSVMEVGRFLGTTASLDRRVGKTQEQEKCRNRIGMHIQNIGLKNPGILRE